MLTVLRTGRISGQRYAPPSRKCIMFVPALFNCFFSSSPMSDGPIHVIKYSNSIQEINWLYSLFASVIPGVSTRPLDRTKLIVYTTVSNPLGCCSSFLLTSASLPPGRHMTSVSTSLSRLTFRTKLLPISSEQGWPVWRNVLHVIVATCSFSVTTSLRRAIALSSVLMRSSRRSFSLVASCSPMTSTAETSPSIVPMRVFTRVPFWRHSGHGHTPLGLRRIGCRRTPRGTSWRRGSIGSYRPRLSPCAYTRRHTIQAIVCSGVTA